MLATACTERKSSDEKMTSSRTHTVGLVLQVPQVRMARKKRRKQEQKHKPLANYKQYLASITFVHTLFLTVPCQKNPSRGAQWSA